MFFTPLHKFVGSSSSDEQITNTEIHTNKQISTETSNSVLRWEREKGGKNLDLARNRITRMFVS